MIRTSIVLALAIGAAQFAGSASADTRSHTRPDAFATKFDYNQATPPEQTYAAFKRTADRACSVSGGFSGKMSVTQEHVKRDCVAGLLDRAVKATGNASLLALHQQDAGENLQLAYTAKR